MHLSISNGGSHYPMTDVPCFNNIIDVMDLCSVINASSLSMLVSSILLRQYGLMSLLAQYFFVTVLRFKASSGLLLPVEALIWLPINVMLN